MNISLNLIPPEKKKTLYHLYLILYARLLIEVLLIYSIFIAIPLIAANFHLRNNLRDVQDKTAVLEEEYVKMNQQIQTATQQLQNLDAAQESFFALTPFLANIFRTAPSSTIYFKNISLDRSAKTAVIQGKAKTRDALLAFKADLEKLPFIVPFSLPISDLTSKEEIDFSFNPTFKP